MCNLLKPYLLNTLNVQALCYGEHDSKQKRWLSGLSAYLPYLTESSHLEDSESKVAPMMAGVSRMCP